MNFPGGSVGGVSAVSIASGSIPATGMRSQDAAERGMMPVAGISAKSETDATSAAGKSASRDVRAGVDQHAEIPLLARLEQQREDRRAWAAALLAAERAAAMAAALNQSVLVDPDEKVDPFDMSRAPEVQRQLDAALRIVRMPDTAGLRFELRL